MELTAHVVREIAVKARRDPRTVMRVLRGDRTSVVAQVAVRDAVRDLGLESVVQRTVVRERDDGRPAARSIA
jgi:hypothetical protein